MSQRSKKSRRQAAPPPPDRRLTAWFAEKRIVLGIVLKFCAWMIFFFALSQTPFYQHLVTQATLGYASAASFVLNGFGETCYVVEATLFWYTKSILTVSPACTALEFSWFLGAAILAVPARFGDKLVGIAAGFVVLQILNVLRVISLYLIGLHSHRYFDLIHDDLWSVLFVVATIGIALGWVGVSRIQWDSRRVAV